MSVNIVRKEDNPEQVAEFCTLLNATSKTSGFGKCRKFSNKVYNTNHTLDSWKFNEWDYGKQKPLITNARGLFTLDDKRIAVRGYDKFFNVGEVPSTKKEKMQKATNGPYDVTLKENGCIIFIGGLENGEIVVCSKHSTGERDGINKNHAMEGHRQLEKQLETIGMKLSDLAKYLYETNLTAVAELCDDSFEEHVLPYSRDDSGLYLHGLNYNTILLNTVPMDQVNAFGKLWGFKNIEYFTHSDFDTLFEFLEECTKTGTYNGREVEGFVIRSKIDERDFFFKYKFEEPYLLYRQFREVTKKYLSGKPIISISVNKHRYITRKYLNFVAPLFNSNPELKEEFQNGHSIIKVRQLFLKDLKETNGMKLLSLDDELSLQSDFTAQFLNLSVNDNCYVFIPIGTIGSGKTTVFQTLKNLYPEWAHVQNDNIGLSSLFKLVDRCLEELQNTNTVLVDRNNSSFRERGKLIEDFQSRSSKYFGANVELKFIAVNLVHDFDEDEVWKITYDRVTKRGDNHQSIKAQTNGSNVVSIMKQFIGRLQPVNPEREPDSLFDLIINLTVRDSSLTNTGKIISEVVKAYPKLIEVEPTKEQLDEAFKKALDYKPTFTKVIPTKKKQPSYYAVSVPKDIVSDIRNVAYADSQWTYFETLSRIQEAFHVTLGHIASSKGPLKPVWKAMTKKFPVEYQNKSTVLLDFYADIKLSQLVIRENCVVCVSVEYVKFYDADFEPFELEVLNKILHITIGTYTPSIKPMESNNTLTKLLGEDQKTKDGVHEVDGDATKVFSLPDIVYEKQRIFAFF